MDESWLSGVFHSIQRRKTKRSSEATNVAQEMRTNNYRDGKASDDINAAIATSKIFKNNEVTAITGTDKGR